MPSEMIEPGARYAVPTRKPPSCVPLVLPRSRSSTPCGWTWSTKWQRDTVGSVSTSVFDAAVPTETSAAESATYSLPLSMPSVTRST
jgi:hypothetical protein